MILDFKNVSAYRGDTLALDNVSFSIAAGQHTAILGPNGAGKSTLLQTIYRQLYPQIGPAGHLKLFGQERWNVWDLRNKMSIVSLDLQQNYAANVIGSDVVLSGFFSSVGNIRHQELTESDHVLTRQTIADVKIEHLLKKPFAQMSTGEQRRCLLARALVNNPDVLIFDEPTTGLDIPSTFLYLETIQQLIANGKTIILVTHHIGEIVPEINNVILLKDGKSFQHGDKADLFTSATLSELFDIELSVGQLNGRYHVAPAAGSSRK